MSTSSRFVVAWALALALPSLALVTVTRAEDPAPDPSVVMKRPPAAGTYRLDHSHASLLFRVDHMGFSNYTARFKRFDAALEFDPRNLAATKVSATVDARSIETDFPTPETLDFNAQLQGEEWLDTSRFPEMKFRSTRAREVGAGKVRLEGELTLRGQTKPVVLDVTYNGGYAGTAQLDPQSRIGISARGTLERSDFGMSYGLPPPGTKFGVGDEVEVILEAEFLGPALK